jgi:hypothetical protein
MKIIDMLEEDLLKKEIRKKDEKIKTKLNVKNPFQKNWIFSLDK